MEHAFDQSYWDEVWKGGGGAAMGTSPANPHLIKEAAGLVPGTALDAGCGAGAEAIWLAQQGWTVTGVDVTEAALALAASRATTAGVADRIRWIQADVSLWAPETRYDLVATHYAHPAMPQLDFYDRIASWVSPGGTLFIVGHLHHHGRGHGDPGHEAGPPSAASVTAADIIARLDPATWKVDTVEKSRRTMHGSEIHDVVVRATRRSVPTEGPR